MTTYNPRPLVARQLEFTTGTIFGGTWLHQNLLDNLINNHYGKLI